MRSVFRFPGGEFHPNVGLNADMRREGLLDDELARLADLAALGAREIAFRVAYDETNVTEPHYFDSIHGGLGRNQRGLTVGRVSADKFTANWIERGFTHHPGRRRIPGKNVLRRGARRAGLKVRRSRHQPPE